MQVMLQVGMVFTLQEQPWYKITFRMTDSTEKEFNVDDQSFRELKEGEKGILTYQGTRYLGFKKIPDLQCQKTEKYGIKLLNVRNNQKHPGTKVYALLLEKFKNFFKKEDTQIKFFIKINKNPNISPFPIGRYSEKKKLCYISAGKIWKLFFIRRHEFDRSVYTDRIIFKVFNYKKKIKYIP